MLILTGTNALQRAVRPRKQRPRPASRREQIARAAFDNSLHNFRRYRGVVRVFRWQRCLAIAELECGIDAGFPRLPDHSPLLECVGQRDQGLFAPLTAYECNPKRNIRGNINHGALEIHGNCRVPE